MKITAPVVYLLLAVLAAVSIAVGVMMEYGLSWGLITGGAFTLTAVVMLYDPNRKPPKR